MSDPPRFDLDPEVVEANLGPLDFAIFEALPDQGSMLGYHELFVSIRHLTHQLNAGQPDGVPPLATSTVGTRVRVLRMGGLAHAVLSLAGNVEGWQRTPRAKELLDQHRQPEPQPEPEPTSDDPYGDYPPTEPGESEADGE
jgi:hypothetical protein